MKKNNHYLAIFTALACLTTALFAADGDFIGTDPYSVTLYNWSDSANWQDGNVPDGAGDIAYITNAIYPVYTDIPKGIALDSNPTVGKLFFSLDKTSGPPVTVALALGTITFDGDAPEINVAAAPNFQAAFVGAAGFGGVLAGTKGFTKTGDGWLYLDGEHTISGPLNLNGGVVVTYNPKGAQNLDAIVNSNSILMTGSQSNYFNSVTVNSGGILEVIPDPAKNPFYILSPSIIIKSNGYFRVTDFYGVTMRGSDITVENGGSIYCNVYQTFIFENNITLEGEGHNGGAIEIVNVSADGYFSGLLTMTGNSRVLQNGGDGSVTFYGPFVGTGDLDFIASSDSEYTTKTYNLNAQNTYTGATSLKTIGCSAVYVIGTNDCFPSEQPLSMIIEPTSNTASLQVNMNNFYQTIPNLNLACGTEGDNVIIKGNPGSKLSVLTNVTQSGGIAEVVDTQLEIAGKLSVNGAMLGMSNVLLLAGASIGGTGSIDRLTVPTGVTVTPGNSIGVLNVISNLSMETGSAIDWEVSETSSDIINIDGTFNISSGGMTINAINAGYPEGTYTIVQTTQGVIGSTNNITMNYESGLTGDVHPRIDGNNLVVDVVPEPAAFALLAILALAFKSKFLF